MTELRSPIFLFGPLGEVDLCQSLDVAERLLEPWQVAELELVSDGNGVLLEAQTDGTHVTLREALVQDHQPGETLRSRLVAALGDTAVTVSAGTATLPDLVESALARFGYSR